MQNLTYQMNQAYLKQNENASKCGSFVKKKKRLFFICKVFIQPLYKTIVTV